MLDNQAQIEFGKGSKIFKAKLDPEEESKDEKPVKPPKQTMGADLRTVLFVIPFATPGSGKTFCWNAIKNHLADDKSWSFQSLSSDDIRGELIAEAMKKNKIDRDKAFAQTMKSGPAAYAQQLKQIVRSCGDKGWSTNHVVYLDKNYPKDAVSRIIAEIQEQLPGNVYPRYVYLIPESEGFLEYPFSANFMAQTFARTQNRSAHATLDNSDPVKLIEIQTMFMGLNRGVRFDDEFI